MKRITYTAYDNYEEFERGGKQKIKKATKKIKTKEISNDRCKIRKKNGSKKF